jgi:hypothetical protein
MPNLFDIALRPAALAPPGAIHGCTRGRRTRGVVGHAGEIRIEITRDVVSKQPCQLHRDRHCRLPKSGGEGAPAADGAVAAFTPRVRASRTN